MRIHKIISGGQTGVDRAALDVALELRIPCGGWCPSGRRAEDGVIPSRYPLEETPTSDYAQRTQWNVRDSDGTLVVTRGVPTLGTAVTVQFATELGKPCLVLDLQDEPSLAAVRSWTTLHHILVLNIAGPREGKTPGIYADTVRLLRDLLHHRAHGQNRVR